MMIVVWTLVTAGVICLIVAGCLLLHGTVVGRQNDLELVQRENKRPKVAVLIPARDESGVIEGLLSSLAKQTYPVRMQDVYVIVENLNDPTVEICAKYHSNVVIRKDLINHPERQRKGYALDIAVKEILEKGRRYDLYFVFDADNILKKDYVEKMMKYYWEGYDITTGYRNSKNGNKNVIAAVSSLTFSMINVLGNQERVKYGENVVFSGTGFFVDGELVQEWGGWPFHGLTEDYEMSLYATLHGLLTYYNEEAEFYDEQPLSYRQTVQQRVRWIRGYFDARRKYIPLMKQRHFPDNYGSIRKEVVGVSPVIWVIIGILLVVAGKALHLGLLGNWLGLVLLVMGMLVAVYVVLLVATIIMIKREKMDLSSSMKIKAALFNPLYLATYVPCALKALLTKEVSWTKIKHGE